VALKTIRRAHPTDVLHFKREFRSLADVAHPNLVPFYDLVVEGETCFFTMERIYGVDLLQYLDDPAYATRRLDRLRHVFVQLAEALAALHRHGKLHRDIKPSNVLVTADGRAIVLDFGLVADVVPEHGSGADRVAGTPAYLSPEDLAGARATVASDWYSVGITLYRALTGHLPFAGPLALQRQRKLEIVPPAPADVASHVPSDLSAACMDLISRDATRRSTGRDRLLSSSLALDESDVRRPFVGRDEPLRTLHVQFRNSRSGAAVVALHGPSGIGKSALIREFLDQLATTPQAVILRGRCYERETVPYKALDAIVDSLSHHLGGLPIEDARALMPPDVRALARLFPVFRQISPIADETPDTADPVGLRRRAFAALRRLLGALAGRQPLVFVVDDLHWADADSALLLDELLRPPDAPPVLTILSFRSEETATKPFLRRLLERTGAEGWVTVELGPIDEPAANDLLDAWLAGVAITGATRQRLGREAAGNPFFIEQLASHVARQASVEDEPSSLIGMIDAQLRSLPETARPLLETLAVCGRSMAPDLLHQASGLSGDDRPLVSLLRAAHLLRSSGSASHVEVYHDRIRQALTADLSSARTAQIHTEMIRTLGAAGIDDQTPCSNTTAAPATSRRPPRTPRWPPSRQTWRWPSIVRPNDIGRHSIWTRRRRRRSNGSRSLRRRSPTPADRRTPPPCFWRLAMPVAPAGSNGRGARPSSCSSAGTSIAD
jgi:hypothetical protein